MTEGIMTEEEMLEYRKDQIALLIDKYYSDNVTFRSFDMETVIEIALDKFLYSNLTIQEIEEEIKRAKIRFKNQPQHKAVTIPQQEVATPKEKIPAPVTKKEVVLPKPVEIPKNDEKEEEKVMEKEPQVSRVEKNHQMVYSILRRLIPLLNKEGIDYHLAGALSAYLYYGEESHRMHEDIDIHINEKDMDRFRAVCESLGFTFKDKRMNSPRVLKNGIPSGSHEVIAYTPNNDFHIGAFCFERVENGTIITKGYYHDEKNKPCAREVVLSSELAKEIYPKKQVMWEGIPVSVTSPEYIYKLKSYTKTEKDKDDIEFLESHMSQDRYRKIKELSKTGMFVQCVPVKALPATNKINHQSLENDNSELSKMLNDSKEEKNVEKEEKKEKEKPKEKVYLPPKRKEKNETGFTTRDAIIFTLVVLIGITVILLILLTK